MRVPLRNGAGAVRARLELAGPAALDPRIEQVLATLRANPDRRVTLAEASRTAGMSPQYFSRTFSAQVGLSFRDFLLGNRLDRALGYADTYLFSRQGHTG